MGRLDMHTLQEFVRLARMGTGFRAVARMLRISPNTEREYRRALEPEGLLVGDPNDLPELGVLQAVLEKRRPTKPAPQQESSVERWAAEVKVMQERGAKPVIRFHAVEQAALLPLPGTTYELAVWHTAKVHADSHVVFDKAMYSVPWRFVGKQVTVRACGGSIALFFEDTRIATHERTTPGKRQMHEAHLPEGRRELRHRSQTYWEARADALGEEVGAYIRARAACRRSSDALFRRNGGTTCPW